MTDILVPFEQEGTKAIVRAWLKQIGDKVTADEPLLELETDKVTQEVPAPADGILEAILLDTEAEAVPGAVLGRLRPLAEGNSEPANSAPTEQDPQVASAGEPPGTAALPALSPAVRRALRQHNVDPAQVSGSGRGGRITRADVDRFVAAGAAAGSNVPPSEAAPSLSSSVPTLSPGAGGGNRSIPHDRMRLAIARNMAESVTTAPHVTALFEADFSAIIAHRNARREAFYKAGANLTFTAYILAAAAAAMKAAPAINSRWFDDRLEIYDDVNIGVGTALGDKGLVVPVVQRVQELSLLGIARSLTDLSERARNGSLSPADVRGGTFTVSNHGVSGSLLAAPIIIVQPQSAILGVGKLEKRVVVREVEGTDSIQIRPMAYVSLTIDHRVIDGHQTNAWLSRFVEHLEGWRDDE